uniref:DEAD/DEAH box helicase family protein n=1 Tax=Spirosoma sp. TaxID=1899569 RepID=UPI003B3A9A8A
MKPRKPSSSRELLIQRTTDGQPLSGVGPGVGYEFIKAYFPLINDTIRIASAYFSLKGYRLGRPHIQDHVIVKMLVGKGDADDAQEAILDEVVKELRQLDSDLWETINEVVARMNSNRFFIRDARSISNPFHCKFYIGDNKFLWHGSANYSENGLSGKARSNAEQVSLLSLPEQIADFSRWFDTTAIEAKDILTPVRELLEQWLKLAKPFDVYLKALSIMLGNHDEENRPFAPVYFQQFIIRNALRQAEEHGGSLIVAATGLGKTIIGSEIARYLQNNGISKRTIIIAPPIVHPKWEEQMRIKDINHFIYSTTVAFLASTGKANHQITDLEKELERADNQTVILIDEAHYYRNQRTNERLYQRASRVYALFLPAVAKGAKIFLLTATAYGTNIHNLNGLLHLLPHKSPKTELFSDIGPWEVKKPDEFINLPVVTILGLPHVLSLARQMNHIDDNGRTYIRYGSRQMYLPKTMRLKPIFYRLPLDQSVQAAFNDKYFAQAGKFTTSFIDENTDEIVTGPVDTLQKIALTSWLSSPDALSEVITYNLRTSGADD